MTSNQQVKFEDLLALPAFKNLPQTQVIKLAGVMLRQVYEPGQFIFIEGEVNDFLWFIKEGKVKILKHSLNGRTLGLCLVNQGKCFGSCPLFNGEKNPATAQALDRVTLFILPRDQLQQLTQRDEQIGAALLRIYTQRLMHLARLSEELGTWTAPDRINEALLRYADYDTPQPTVTLTHEKLAELAGTVREVVTRHLKNLEDEGFVQTSPGQIILTDLDGLSTRCLYREPM